MNEIVEKLIDDFIDKDLAEFLMGDSKTVNLVASSTTNEQKYHKRWELLDDPIIAILHWQYIREYKR